MPEEYEVIKGKVSEEVKTQTHGGSMKLIKIEDLGPVMVWVAALIFGVVAIIISILRLF